MKDDQISAELRERCKDFRQEPTQAETVLWNYLRARRFEDLKFRRQHPFHGFIIDFFCFELNLAVEVDGAVHLSPDQVEYDLFRTQKLSEYGLVVLRIWNSEVINHPDEVLEQIRIAASERRKAKLSI